MAKNKINIMTQFPSSRLATREYMFYTSTYLTISTKLTRALGDNLS